MKKPSFLSPDLRVCARLARDLGHRKHWVVWAAEMRDGKWTKRPLMIDGSPASHSQPRTWCHFDAAATALSSGRFDGLGFVLSSLDPFTGIDLDGCVASGEASTGAAAMVSRFDSYAEVSPSGGGVRILIRARKRTARARAAGIEIYDNLRFLTLTGRAILDRPIAERQTQLDALTTELWGNTGGASDHPQPVAMDSGRATVDDLRFLLTLCDLDPSVHELYSGRWEGRYGSHSQADAALIAKLLYWGADPERVQRLFRESGLYRGKTDARRPGGTYLTTTIARSAAWLREREH